ncbi:MAG: hypothetical protein II977_09545 [Oscillospiraceae bacterium]|nr:hypothetical protein [Oscillospiraceae bacterium]
MFSLVALMCFYLGGNNIRKAFMLAPFGQWKFINWALLLTGILLIPAGILCMKQAMKDFRENKEKKAELEKEQKARRQQQFFYDDNEEFSDGAEEFSDDGNAGE